MSVTREELQKATDTLSKKIDDRHDKIIMKWDELATSINNMNINIGVFIEKFDHQEEANDRITASITKVQTEQNLMLISIVELQTNQKNSKNFWDKFGVPIMLIVFVGLSAINYLKVTP
jgi:di/tricarboxylate transporter